MKRSNSLAFTFAIIAFALAAGCATPKEINGRKVLKTLWQNGRVVYVVESDHEAMKRGLAEGKDASKNAVITPVK